MGVMGHGPRVVWVCTQQINEPDFTDVCRGSMSPDWGRQMPVTEELVLVRPSLRSHDSHDKAGRSMFAAEEEAHFARVYSAAEMQMFHCEHVHKILLSGLDPSTLIGFMVGNEAEWVDLRRGIKEVSIVFPSLSLNIKFNTNVSSQLPRKRVGNRCTQREHAMEAGCRAGACRGSHGGLSPPSLLTIFSDSISLLPHLPFPSVGFDLAYATYLSTYSAFTLLDLSLSFSICASCISSFLSYLFRWLAAYSLTVS
jgi:hypothetical protein